MSEPSVEDTEALRIRARERIEQGRLPRTKAARTWGGLGSGLECDLCDAAIASSEPEFELQIDLSAPSQSVRFHRQCHAIWNEVREEFPSGGWRAVAREMPPIGVIVEARVALSRGAASGPDARVIILNVIRLNAPAEATWLNATTGGPLPEGWRPVEWRPIPAASADEATASRNSGSPGTRAMGT